MDTAHPALLRAAQSWAPTSEAFRQMHPFFLLLTKTCHVMDFGPVGAVLPLNVLPLLMLLCVELVLLVCPSVFLGGKLEQENWGKLEQENCCRCPCVCMHAVGRVDMQPHELSTGLSLDKIRRTSIAQLGGPFLTQVAYLRSCRSWKDC